MKWLDRLRGWDRAGRVLIAEAEAERAKAEAEAEQHRTRRQTAKTALRQLAFEGARRQARWSDWHAPGGDADTSASSSRERLRNRARDLERNDPNAAKGMMVLVAHGIGQGIRPRPATTNDNLNDLLSRLWKEWADEAASVAGNQTFYLMQAVAFAAMFRDGEVLVRMKIAPPSMGLKIPLQIEVLEADFLDSGKSAELSNGGEIVQGVEKNAYGRIVAYWLFDRHPGRGGRTPVSVRVDADDVIHILLAKRPGAGRGWSHFAPVIATLRDIGDINNAELMKQKIAALFGIIATVDDETGDTMTEAVEDASGAKFEDLAPGTIAYAKPGTTITTLNPPSTQNYESFVRTQDRRVASGFGITHAQLTGDLSQSSFSSTRAGMNEFWAWMDQVRGLEFVPAFCARIWRRWVTEANKAGVLSVKRADCSWTMPAKPVISPLEEAASTRAGLRDGTLTLGMAIDKQGNDWRRVLAERAREKGLLDELGLILDSSPWDMSGAGQLQPIAEATAEDPQALGTAGDSRRLRAV